MQIQVWQSFSCNNSSSYRVVARFDDPKTAADVAKELTAFFAQHARELDEAIMDPDFEFGRPLPVAIEFGKKHGIEWNDSLSFGEAGEQVGDEPTVAAEGNVVAMFHTYCTGFGGDILTYLTNRGGKLDAPGPRMWAMMAPEITVVFAKPAGSKIDDTLEPFFIPPLPRGKQRVPPWSKRRSNAGHHDQCAFFSDGKTVAFHWPIDPGDVAPLRAWLAENGVTSPIIELCNEDNLLKIRRLKRAVCDACGTAPLEYLHAALHKLDSDQVACPKCGGMFDVESLADLPPAKPPLPAKTKTKKKTAKKKTTAKAKMKTKTKTKRAS